MKLFGIFFALLIIVASAQSECNNACPDIYLPVCGKNAESISKTFPSRCDLDLHVCETKNAGFEYFKEGDCSAVSSDASCDFACAAVYTPVCARNDKGDFHTFSSKCNFEISTCRNKNSGYQLYSDGECATKN